VVRGVQRQRWGPDAEGCEGPELVLRERGLPMGTRTPDAARDERGIYIRVYVYIYIIIIKIFS